MVKLTLSVSFNKIGLRKKKKKKKKKYIYIYIYIYTHTCTTSQHTHIQYYKVWIKCKWINRGKGVEPSLYLHVVGIEKGAFRSLWTMADRLTYLYIYIYVCVCVCVSIHRHLHRNTHTHTHMYMWFHLLMLRAVAENSK